MEKIALVTGSSRGIGRAVARKLAAGDTLFASTIGCGRTAPRRLWRS